MLRADGILVLVSTAVFCAVIVHVIIGAVPSSQRLSSRQVVDNCTTDLARDLYGLGVRLGVSCIHKSSPKLLLTLTGILPVVLGMGG